MFELSDPDRGLLEQTYALRFRLKFAYVYLRYNKKCKLLCKVNFA
jgi:hypothetical protein